MCEDEYAEDPPHVPIDVGGSSDRWLDKRNDLPPTR